jgi:hypothetical protein
MGDSAISRREALLSAISTLLAPYFPVARTAVPLSLLELTEREWAEVEQEQRYRETFRAIQPMVIEKSRLTGLTGITESVFRSLLSDDLPVLAHRGKVGMVKLALRAGRDVNAVDDKGHTGLHQAAKFGHLGVAKLLVSCGADVAARTPDGRTALDLARWMFFDEVAAFLESVGRPAS